MTAKIIDLGLAKAVNEPGFQTAISMAGTFVGTPEFASLEQFAGVGVEIRSDLYSLGVVLWEMVTGHAVFRGSPAEVMYQHQHAFAGRTTPRCPGAGCEKAPAAEDDQVSRFF